VSSGPVDVRTVPNGQQEVELFGEQRVVVGKDQPEQREGLGEGTSTGHDLGPAAGDEVQRGELLEDADGIGGAEHRDGYLILAAIAEDRPPSQLALAQSLGFDKSAMTSLLDGLETANLLDRRPDPSDRRARQLVITPTGVDALSRARVRLDVAEQRLLSPLDESEVSAFRSMLARVAQSALQGRSPGDLCADGDV
jgi:DNA-binding MarR family transcriptional regulator